MTSRPAPLSFILLAGAMIGAITAATLPGFINTGTVYKGTYQQQLEKQFNRHVLWRDNAVAVWTFLQYSLFNEGRPGVLIGLEGWLFSSDEFSLHPPDSLTPADITRIRTQLDAQNIPLLIALVPDKSRIYADKLDGHVKPVKLEERYAQLINILNAADLSAVLQKDRATQETFLRTDTHWTPAGATRAAEALSKLTGWRGSTPYLRSKGQVYIHQGDLLNFLPLGYLRKWTSLQPDQLEPMVTTPIIETGLLDETPTAPVVLVGTSFSANPRWDFAGALQAVFNSDVLNMADAGTGPLAPMQAYLASDTFRLAPPKLVIWEIPERYIRMDGTQ